MHVFVIPSWVGGISDPMSGIFILEQAQAIGRLHPDWKVSFSAVNPHFLTMRLVTPRKVIRGVSKLWRRRRSPVGDAHGAILHMGRHVMVRQSALLAGDIAPFVRSHRRNLEIASQYGRPDILHAHVAWPGGAVARELSREFGIPYAVTEHMGPFPFPEAPFADGAGRATPTVMRPLEDADAVVAVSGHLAAAIRQNGLQRPMRIIPNLVDTKVFCPAPRPRTDQPFVFLTVSRLTEDKGISDLLLAARDHSRNGAPCRFRIVGPGPIQHYRAMAERLGLAHLVDFLGPLGRNGVAAEMQDAHALVMPTRHESFGAVAIEAMASGIPVLATRSGGPESVLTPETGLLVEAAAPADLARGMAMMMSLYDGFDRGAIVGHCRGRYSAEAVVAQIESLYFDILARPKVATGY